MSHKVPTWAAYVASLATLVLSYVWATFFPSAPYTIEAGAVVSITSAYFVKRASDKKIDYDCDKVDKARKENGDGAISTGKV